VETIVKLALRKLSDAVKLSHRTAILIRKVGLEIGHLVAETVQQNWNERKSGRRA